MFKHHNHIQCQCPGCECLLDGYEFVAVCKFCYRYCRSLSMYTLSQYIHREEHDICEKSRLIAMKFLAV